jgi:hypothetical protein
MGKHIVRWLMIALTLLPGCHVNPAPTVLTRFAPGQQPSELKTYYHGLYRLYRMNDPSAADGRISPTIVDRERLEARQPLGFRKDKSGTVVAVAGSRRVPLEKGCSYQWVMKADEAQIDPEKTSLLIAAALVTPLVLLGSAATAWFIMVSL